MNHLRVRVDGTGERTRMAMSAWPAPPIMFGTKHLGPGPSTMMKCFFSLSNQARPTSTVLSLSRLSPLRSCPTPRTNPTTRETSLALRCDPSPGFVCPLDPFRTCKMRRRGKNDRFASGETDISCPPMVDLPASTCPQKRRFTDSFFRTRSRLTTTTTRRREPRPSHPSTGVGAEGKR